MIQITMLGKNLSLKVKLNGYIMGKFDEFPGFKKWSGRNLILRPTPANLDHLCTLDDLEFMCDESKRVCDNHQTQRNDEALLMVEKHSGEALDMGNYIFKRKPMTQQEEGLKLSLHKKNYALLMEQGLGKTKVIIDNAAYLYEQGELDALVIIAWPNGLHFNWTDWEIPEDLPDRIETDIFAWRPNFGKKRQLEMQTMIDAKGKFKIFAFNVEAFSAEKARGWLLKILKTNRTMLVIDQSASIKNPAAKRTKFLTKTAAELAKYRRILDGSPVAENPAELFSQFYFLDWTIIGHDTYTGFKNEFCMIGRFNEIAGFKNIDRLMERIQPYYFRALEEECLNLPKRIYSRFSFDLSKEENRIFQDIKNKKFAFFGDEFIETPLPIVKATRLQQITCGWWPDPENFKSIEKQPSRIKALKDLISTLDGKCLIFARFKADIRLIKQELGDDAVTYYGETPRADREENKKAFQLGDKRFLIGNPSTAGIGHTFTAASHVIFYSNGHSLRLRIESEKRAHRKGQEKRLTIWDLIANDTLDKKILMSLKNKKDIAEVIMSDPESFFLE